MGPPKARKTRTNSTRTKPRAVGRGENGNMNQQLAPLGLKVVNMTGDGNCFFRAIADQLEGNEEEHAKYRRMVVDYLEEHKSDFEPFLEDEMTFDDYCSNMRHDGTWAGHMELQAMSLATRCNICIHRPHGSLICQRCPGPECPFDYVSTLADLELSKSRHSSTPTDDFKCLELTRTGVCLPKETIGRSYHGEEHYNSVRPIDDDGAGPPRLETVKAATKMVNEPPPAKDRKKQGTKAAELDGVSVKLVMAGSGRTDPAYVKQVLDDMHGDTSAATEFLIAEKNSSEEISQSANDAAETLSNGAVDGSMVDRNTAMYEPKLENKEAEGIPDDESKIKPSRLKKSETGNTAKPVVSRNKACPCGSKKKYKACCGAVHHKSVVTILTNGPEETLSNKARKDRSRAAKAATPVGSSSDRSSHAKESTGFQAAVLWLVMGEFLQERANKVRVIYRNLTLDT